MVSPAYTVCVPANAINSLFFSFYFKTEPLIGQFRRYSQGLVKDTLNLKYEAFARIEDGSYGRCEECDGEIGIERRHAERGLKRKPLMRRSTSLSRAGGGSSRPLIQS